MQYVEYVVKCVIANINLSDAEKAALLYEIGQYYGEIDLSPAEWNRLKQ